MECIKYLLENVVCQFKMHRHGASHVSTKTDLAIFWWNRQHFCLIIKEKALGMVVRYVFCSPNQALGIYAVFG